MHSCTYLGCMCPCSFCFFIKITCDLLSEITLPVEVVIVRYIPSSSGFFFMNVFTSLYASWPSEDASKHKRNNCRNFQMQVEVCKMEMLFNLIFN